MWIRSQDRESLINAESIKIFPIEIIPITGGVIQSKIVGYKLCSLSPDCELGSYSTKERALEVFDDIQERTAISETVKNSNGVAIQSMANDLCQEEFNDWCRDVFVYQMPEE